MPKTKGTIWVLGTVGTDKPPARARESTMALATKVLGSPLRT